ncbi:MAG: DNA gyrase subunit A [Actinomyces sp.]|nr:MAG: DNA gyrase subunit A [Actinomyces sp.]
MSDQTPPTDGPTDAGDATDANGDDVVVIEIQEEMERSFLDYAMSVIISRALPDARDGLKPVHRRILWGMFDQGFRPDRSHVKCARVSGDVAARFHPHGTQAIYDALARMAQPFSLRHPLIDFHGNYGSPEDPPAADRYTEARLAPLAMHMLADIDEDTVDFVDNYSGEFTEPTVLPARFPNLLVNGSQGIAVGMATNIPPHNLGEVIDAVDHLLAHPDATVDDLMAFVKGPDFPTGGQILGRSGIESAYRTGRGSVKMRARVEVEETGRRTELVVTEMPYQVSVAQVARKIADLVNARELDGIANVNDESSGDDTRFVITLKRDANPEVVLNNLWKHTPLQSSFGVNMVALVDGVPRTLDLREALVAYVDHQIEVVTRRSRYRLDEAERRLHILEGLIKALDLIDAIIATIRASEDRAAARSALMAEPFEFSEVQANYILDMQLGRLTRMGRSELETEAAEKRTLIAELRAILADDAKLRGVIREELAAIREEFAEPRRSELTIDPGEIDIEDLIDDEDVVFTMSASGYVKTVPADAFRTQGRGGRGVAGASLKDDDSIVHLISTTAHSYLLFFSNRGRVYRLKAHEVPMSSRTARGTAIVNLLPLQPDETIEAVIDTRDYESYRFLFFATARGRVKKTAFTAYDSSLRAGIIAIRLNDDDELVAVVPADEGDDILLSSRLGQTIRFAESEVRAMGRSAAGVVGMRFKHEGDRVVACAVARQDAELLHVTEGGYGKRTRVSEFPVKHRGGMGVVGIKLVPDRGEVVGAVQVEEGDEILLASESGVVIRVPVADVSVQGRSATGVRIMNLDPDDKVAVVALLARDDEESDDGTDATDRTNSADGTASADASSATDSADGADPGV